MITFAVFSIIAIVLLFLAYRISNIEDDNLTYLNYFFGAFLFSGIGQVIGLLFIVGFFLTDDIDLLFYSNVFASFVMYLGAAFIINVPLQLLFPKFKKRKIVSILVVILGLVIFGYHFFIDYQPIVNASGIIEWNIPPLFSMISGLPLLFIWGSTTLVFFINYIKSKFRSTKSLIMGVGFLMASTSFILQDFAVGVEQYFAVYFMMALGFIIVFVGLFIEKDN